MSKTLADLIVACLKQAEVKRIYGVVGDSLNGITEATRDLTAETDPHALEDVDVAVVRASFGVAESGSVLLHDAALGVNALVYLAQHLVVLLDPVDIVPNMHFAYRRPEFHEGHYAAFHTGPSATSDIEGVLIHGAQGVRSLTVILLPEGRP